MINIGIERHTGLVYEGDGSFWRGVWPTPVITPAMFVPPNENLKAESSSNAFGYRFREDSFDPTSRIRRGRFYCAGEVQPKHCQAMRHPGWPFDHITPGVHVHGKMLETFNGNPIWHKYISGKNILPLVVLGVDDRFTVWRIIDVEAISTGEDLVTLKARGSFGILPQIKNGEIPEAFQAKLNEALSTFVDEAHRSSPVSVIDRARDAATQALLASFNLQGQTAQDLGRLIKRLEDESQVIAASAAKIIARLHARAKPSEQEKHELPSIREQDSELAIQCLGSLLYELGFAENS